jgi:hypothetical protein
MHSICSFVISKSFRWHDIILKTIKWNSPLVLALEPRLIHFAYMCRWLDSGNMALVRPMKLRKVRICADDVRAPLPAMVYVHVRLKAMLSAPSCCYHNGLPRICKFTWRSNFSYPGMNAATFNAITALVGDPVKRARANQACSSRINWDEVLISCAFHVDIDCVHKRLVFFIDCVHKR